MKIIVPIKQILDPKGITVRRDKERIFINQEEYILDRGSKAAIEAALCLKEAGTAGAEVIALCLGAARADAALREALAMGCDTAYLLSDPAFEQADVSITVRVLAAAVEKLGGAEAIVAGRESSDTGSGQIGPRLAEALGYAQVTDVYELAAGDGVLRATRRWGQGRATYAAVEVELPAVVTVAPEAFKPRYAHGARIMNAYREWEVPVWNAADLALDETALQPLQVLRSETFPPPLEIGETFRGDPASVAQDVVTALRLQRLV